MAILQSKLRDDYLKKEQRLVVKKQRAFAEGRIGSWELRAEDTINVDQVKLRKDEAFALPLMFPKVFHLSESNRKLWNFKEQILHKVSILTSYWKSLEGLILKTTEL